MEPGEEEEEAARQSDDNMITQRLLNIMATFLEGEVSRVGGDKKV